MLYIDIRKASDYGIGVYIRNVVPKVIGLMCRFEFKESICVVASLDQDVSFLENCGTYSIRRLKSPPFSLMEQFELRKMLGANDYFWATSLSHPLLYSNNLFTIHDVGQLEGEIRHNISLFKRIIFGFYFKSISSSGRCLIFNSKFTQYRYNFIFKKSDQIQGVTLLAPEIYLENKDSINYDKDNYFIVVGNLRPHKNLPFLIKSFLDNPLLEKYELKIIGFNESDKIKLSKFHPRLNRIKLVGYLSNGDLLDQFVNAKGLIFPSIYEGFGLPAVEAMACGCPVIASNNTSLPEVCGDVGHYFDPRSQTSFDSAIESFFSLSDESFKNLINNSYDRGSVFSWNQCANETFSLLKRAIL